MVSFSFEKVITLLESALAGTNKCYKIALIRSPKGVEKLLKIKWGAYSDIVSGFSGKSCLNTTFLSPKYIVGPRGIWEKIIPSGSPLCSCKIIKSVKSYFYTISTISFSTYAPLFIRTAFGIKRAISWF